MSTETVYLSHQKKIRVVLLSYHEAKNVISSLQAMEDEIASFKRFDCYEKVLSDIALLTRTLFPFAGLFKK
jgi:hypothetical protein